jgi:hypothetical protein
LPEESSQIASVWHKIKSGLAFSQSLLRAGYQAGRLLVITNGRLIEKDIGAF